MRYRLLATLGAIMPLVTACTVPGANQSGGGLLAPLRDVSSHVDFRYRMTELGYRYEGTQSFHSQDRLNLEFDYLGYRDSLAATDHFKCPGDPIFTTEATEARWGRYGYLAGFSSPDEMFAYLRVGYAIAMPAAQSARIKQPVIRASGQLL